MNPSNSNETNARCLLAMFRKHHAPIVTFCIALHARQMCETIKSAGNVYVESFWFGLPAELRSIPLETIESELHTMLSLIFLGESSHIRPQTTCLVPVDTLPLEDYPLMRLAGHEPDDIPVRIETTFTVVTGEESFGDSVRRRQQVIAYVKKAAARTWH